jgi:hypothetical protein
VKTTANDADWPAGSVIGSEIPDTTNSALLTPNDVMLTGEPLAVTVPLSDAVEPTATLPKLRVVGETANWPRAAPVPDNVMFAGEFDAFDMTDNVPLAAPPLGGVNVAVKVTL